jgi:hypothetical protein
MPSAQIRSAIVKYFTNAPGLSSVAKDEPYFTPGQAWINNGIPGTAAFVHIDHQAESWATVGGALGQRVVEYDVALVIQYQYRIPATSTGMDGWVDGLDAVLDDVVKMLRADPTLGCGGNGPVWQAGIKDMDIVLQRDLPVRDKGGKIWSINYVMFKVTEIVAGTG